MNEMSYLRKETFDRITRGFVAGAIGGVVGGAMKLVGEAIFPPRSPGEPIPPAVAVSKLLKFLSGSPLRPEHTTLAVQGFHWSLSIGMAAVYGVLAEFFPIARIGYGLGFGMFVLLITHETTLPLLGLSLPWKQIPLKEHLSEIVTHAMYGVSVELVRSAVRNHAFTPEPKMLA
jgi:putative membrane protein